MTIDVSMIQTIILIAGFLGVIAALFVRTPKETVLDHESRIRELERDASGNGPLWEERHTRHEETLEKLTIAVNALAEKIEHLTGRFEGRG